MKSHNAQSATSLPRAPRDEASSRLTKYAVTMGVRTACFILMAVVQPFGWWTWAFAAGAIILPYFAVVFANVGMSERSETAIPPERALAAHATQPAGPAPTVAPGVIRIAESPVQSRPAPPAPPRAPGSDESTGTAA